MHFGSVDVFFIAQWSPACFDHSRGHLQGGDNKNTDIIKMCLKHCTVSEFCFLCLSFRAS